MSDHDHPSRATLDATCRPCLALALALAGIALALVTVAVPSETPDWVGPLALACVVVSVVPASILSVVLRVSKRGRR